MTARSHVGDTAMTRVSLVAVVEIYTTPLCPYCVRAKRLLKSKNVSFVEIDLWTQPSRRAEMMHRADGRSTVPQVFVGGRGLGGCDDLCALDHAGRLDAILAEGAAPQ